MEEHFVGKVGQKAIIEQGGKVLLVRSSEDENKWELPGGRLNMKESPIEGLKRELLEELNIEIEVHNLVYTEQSLHTQKGEWSLFLIYSASVTNSETTFTPAIDGEIVEIKWIDKDQLYDWDIFETYRRGLEVYFKKSTAT
ncbi:MAG: NUDIX hydrolase [Bacteroidia bacterium]|jgi:ADP-ribose pyrophosphatase YjhB (NUDIX family)